MVSIFFSELTTCFIEIAEYFQTFSLVDENLGAWICQSAGTPTFAKSEVASLCGTHIKGSRPEWCISNMIYSRDTPFWTETLDIRPYFCHRLWTSPYWLRRVCPHRCRQLLCSGAEHRDAGEDPPLYAALSYLPGGTVARCGVQSCWVPSQSLHLVPAATAEGGCVGGPTGDVGVVGSAGAGVQRPSAAGA